MADRALALEVGAAMRIPFIARRFEAAWANPQKTLDSIAQLKADPELAQVIQDYRGHVRTSKANLVSAQDGLMTLISTGVISAVFAASLADSDSGIYKLLFDPHCTVISCNQYGVLFLVLFGLVILLQIITYMVARRALTVTEEWLDSLTTLFGSANPTKEMSAEADKKFQAQSNWRLAANSLATLNNSCLFIGVFLVLLTMKRAVDGL